MPRVFLRSTQIDVTQYPGDVRAPELVEFPILTLWITRAAMIAPPATQPVKVYEALQLSNEAKLRRSFVGRNNKLSTWMIRFPLS